MAQRGDYSKDEKFKAYDSKSTGTDDDKSSYGFNADGPMPYLSDAHTDYLTRDGFDRADYKGGGCAYKMPHWSDPPYPMPIGRIETAQDSNDEKGETPDPAQAFRDFKHSYIRLGVEDEEDVNGGKAGELV